MNDMMSHIGAILTVGLLLAQVSSEKFRQEDVGEKNLARVNSTSTSESIWIAVQQVLCLNSILSCRAGNRLLVQWKN